MKYRNFIFLLVCFAWLITGCGNETPLAPDSKELTAIPQEASLAKNPNEKFTPYTAVEIFVKDLDPGKQWISEDNILHVRNRIRVERIESEEARIAGQITLIQNLNYNLITGDGTYESKCYHEVNKVRGTWEGTASGKLVNSIFSGKGVAQGTGELEGLILKLELHDTLPPWLEVAESGYIIEKN
ncbi:hypothetical protein L0128_17900 [candidate division KSB1 bacterium]|nr:hypothetical protein [candidate division KSB1 bacterium]